MPSFKAPKSVSAPFKKTQIVEFLAGRTELPKKEINSVLDALGELMHIHLKKRSCGEFTLPGMLKVVKKMKPATKARKGINPFTGEECVFQAKPARVQLKIKALKKMKEMAE
jgi:nucleoid DNA-binding protein